MAPVAAAGLHFLVFLGSVRENRNADRMKNFIANELQKHNVSFSIFDPQELNYTKVVTPLHYYPNPADAPQYMHEHNNQIKKANGYIVVTPEYHGAIAPALTTMMDQFPPISYAMKPAAIVSYSKGQYGGIRAAMQLRVYLSELGMVHVPSLISVPKVEDNITKDGKCNSVAVRSSTEAVLQELVWFAEAIKKYAAAKQILYKGKVWNSA